MSKSRAEGLCTIPVSTSENFFCDSSMNSSTLLKPNFCDMAGLRLQKESVQSQSAFHTSLSGLAEVITQQGKKHLLKGILMIISLL